MTTGLNGRTRLYRFGRLVVALVAAGLSTALVQEASAQTAPLSRHKVARARAVPPVALRPLTVRRRYVRLAPPPGPDEYEYAPGLFRRWNDPNLESFGGWRIGGDSFYGDGAGDPITRGNPSLGMISGYGPARGGYGGPHFDSVGGFHNGPGPDAQEDADYASGSIWRPDYGGVVPHYPSVKARLAKLNAGVYGSGAPSVVSHAAVTAPAVGVSEPVEDDGAETLKTDDLFPDIDLGDF